MLNVMCYESLTHFLNLSSVKSFIYRLFSILNSDFMLNHFCFYNVWIYPRSHSATRIIRAACYRKFYFDFPSPLLAYSPLAKPARVPLTQLIPFSHTHTHTHIYHCFIVTCFNGGFVSTFVCRWGHVRAAFGAAGAGGRGETDPRAAGETGPAEETESNAGNITGWRSQVRGKYAARC